MGLNLLLEGKTAMEILIPLTLMLSTIINLFCEESGVHALVELLVIVAIIGILLPTLARSKAVAK